MRLQPLQGTLILAIELGRGDFPGINPACELLAVRQGIIFQRTQRHAGPRSRLGTFGPFRVADTMGIAVRPEAGDILLKICGTSKPWSRLSRP